MNEKLELLSMREDYKISAYFDGYSVESENSDLAAHIYNDNIIQYSITGCYNSGSDDIEINMDELEKLKNFCELMIK